MVDSGDNAFVMLAGCLVMFMTPGVGFFYGGMVNKKNLLSTIAYCTLVFCVASLVWVLLGFSLSFGNPSGATGFIGDCFYCGLRNLVDSTFDIYAPTIPVTTFLFFQTMFAAITPAIFVGSLVGRVKLTFLIALTICFQIIIYCPIAYWNWNVDGWLHKMGAIDFAGGNVIHIPAGMAGLASAIYMGKSNKKAQKQNSSSISLTLIGVAILWLGWFGFNGGSAVAANLNASVAILNSHIAACTAGLVWAFAQFLVTGKTSILGWCCGSVCGLVAITPACGFVPLWSSIPIGAVGSILSYTFCHLKSKHFEELQDTLDVFGCHGVSAIWGGIAAGCFASLDSGNVFSGLFFYDAHQFGINVLGVVVCVAYSFIMTLILCFLLGIFIEPRVTDQQEHDGLDFAIHGQQNDPLTQKDVVNILRTMNNFNSLGNIIMNQSDHSSQRLAKVNQQGGNKQQGLNINLKYIEKPQKSKQNLKNQSQEQLNGP